MDKIINGLLKYNYLEKDIKKIMGENFLKLFDNKDLFAEI
jgi:microsomal dipeptidase-like Zn-dependent dipeptidase